MTDNEIIKALECCKEEEHCGEECPYYSKAFKEKLSCLDAEKGLTPMALDLIKRQKAYIETLKERIIVQKYKEVPLGNEVVYRIGWENALVEAIKAEAYKEFAERLKSHFWSKADCDVLIRGVIDEILTELTKGDESDA